MPFCKHHPSKLSCLPATPHITHNSFFNNKKYIIHRHYKYGNNPNKAQTFLALAKDDIKENNIIYKLNDYNNSSSSITENHICTYVK